MRSRLSDGDLRWGGLDGHLIEIYRRRRREIDQPSQDTEEAELLLGQLASRYGWGGTPSAANLGQEALHAWIGATRQLLIDIEIPWRDRNVQGLAVVTRALAEHTGIGSLMFRITYPTGEVPSPSGGLVEPPPGPERLPVARARMTSYLDSGGHKYDDMTVLSGFAHPGRFGMQIYLSHDLGSTRTIAIDQSLAQQHGTWVGLRTANVCVLASLLLTVGDGYATAS